MSFAQQRLWFIAQLEGPSAVYNIPMALRLEGDLDVAALEAALGDVIARHEVLRTVFPAVDGQPYQRVLALDELGWALPVTEAAGEELPGGGGQAAAEPFDLAAEIPLRARLLAAARRGARAGAGDAPHRHRRLVAGVLARDSAAAYAARRRGPGAGVGAAAGAVRRLRAVAAGAAGR